MSHFVIGWILKPVYFLRTIINLKVIKEMQIKDWQQDMILDFVD